MRSEDAPSEGSIGILLIEPNPGDSRPFSESFKDAKILNTIHTVPDGETALDFVHQRGSHADDPRPALISLEPKLPGKSGLDVLSELKNEPVLSEIPVVVLTSTEMGEDIVKPHGWTPIAISESRSNRASSSSSSSRSGTSGSRSYSNRRRLHAGYGYDRSSAIRPFRPVDTRGLVATFVGITGRGQWKPNASIRRLTSRRRYGAVEPVRVGGCEPPIR